MTGNLPSRDHRTRKPKSSSTSTKAQRSGEGDGKRHRRRVERGSRVPRTPLGDHNYTAVATEANPLGNPEGKSNTVSLHGQHRTAEGRNQPSIRGKRIERQIPSFKGTASASTEVVVRVYEGTTESRKPAQPEPEARGPQDLSPPNCPPASTRTPPSRPRRPRSATGKARAPRSRSSSTPKRRRSN